ncbi:MAG: BrnT family toxin [Acidobacteriaceae bacterium]
MDFSRIIGFDWDAGNARKNEKHSVTQAEIEQIFFRQPLIVIDDKGHSTTETRLHALGRTDQERWLHVTFTVRAGGTLIRAISARTMSRKEKPIYAAALKANP